MNISIIGAGDVAQSLASGLIEAGHNVMIGSPESTAHSVGRFNKKHKAKKAGTGSTTEAASFGEVAFLATAWHSSQDILQQIRPQLAGKIIVDITNPLLFEDDRPPSLAFGHDMSGGELIQQSLPDSHVVKTLNFVSHRHMVRPSYKDGRPSMLVCGNNTSAKQYIAELLHDLGWKDVIDIGRIEKSRLLEPLCLLWLEVGLARDTWDHAFSILWK